MARPIKVLVTTDAVVSELQRRAKAPTSAYRDRFRAEIILLRLSGLKVAARLGTSVPTVSLWSNRFGKSGIAGLNDKTGRGRKPSIPPLKIERFAMPPWRR